MNADGQRIYLVQELAAGTDLFTHVRSLPRKVMDDVSAAFLIAQVSYALNYLHSNRILYRDLKPENVMLTTEGYIKVGALIFAHDMTLHSYDWCAACSS